LGRRVNYAESNTDAAITVVLVHGFRANHKGLLPLAHLLEPDYHVLLLDLPGYGKSEPMATEITLQNYANFLHAFFKKIQLKNFVLFGHSFGGSVSLAYAAFYPDDPSSLLLYGPVTYSRTLAATLARAYYGIGRVLKGDLRRIWLVRKITTVITGLFLLKTKDKAVRRYILEDDIKRLEEMDVDVVIDTSLCYKGTDFHELAKKIKNPALIMAGSLDNVAPIDSMRQLAGQMIDGTIEVSPNRGHIACVEYPEETARRIKQWIREVHGR
jgi:pimeloyl-ACP methyl ester carboxylesterase